MYDEIGPGKPPAPVWKEELRERFEEWLQALETSELGDSEQPEEPDLYSFYAELLALRNDSRKAQRKAADAFTQFGEILRGLGEENRLLRERLPAPLQTSEWSRAQCLALVEFLDRLQRLRLALDRTPAPSALDFFGSTRPWQEAWKNLRQGVSILLTHFEGLTRSAGIEPVRTLHSVFDPLSMIAVASEAAAGRPLHQVIEEIRPGYRRESEMLRAAEVKITTTNPT